MYVFRIGEKVLRTNQWEQLFYFMHFNFQGWIALFAILFWKKLRKDWSGQTNKPKFLGPGFEENIT